MTELQLYKFIQENDVEWHQKKAFERVEKAIAAARKKGLYFYGRQNVLEAYTKPAMEYLERKSICDVSRRIPCLKALNVLTDCGADDSWSYTTEEDEELFNP